jgi:hypothetical protein
MQEPFQKHAPIVFQEKLAIPTESIWFMLSSGKKGKEAEQNILSNLKYLCRTYSIPISRSKEIMLHAIQRHELAGQVFVKSYISWYSINRTASSSDTSDLPNQISFAVGSVEHKCKGA